MAGYASHSCHGPEGANSHGCPYTGLRGSPHLPMAQDLPELSAPAPETPHQGVSPAPHCCALMVRGPHQDVSIHRPLACPQGGA